MRLNEDTISGLQIKVRDYITCETYGTQITSYNDRFYFPPILGIDYYELDRLIDALSNIKNLIDSNRRRMDYIMKNDDRSKKL